MKNIKNHRKECTKSELARIRERVLANEIPLEKYLDVTEQHILAQEELIKAIESEKAAQKEVIETQDQIIAELEKYIASLQKSDASNNEYIAQLHTRIEKLTVQNKTMLEERAADEEYGETFKRLLN